MTRQRETYPVEAPQLCLDGIPGPQAQGALFEQRTVKRDAEQYPPCPCCGGPRAADRASCVRCEEMGVQAPELPETVDGQRVVTFSDGVRGVMLGWSR